MNVIVLLVIMLLSSTLGIWILFFLYGINPMRAVIVSLALVAMFPVAIAKTTKKVICILKEKHAFTKFGTCKLICKITMMCVALIPIALNEAIMPLSEIRVTKKMRKEASIKKANEKLHLALSDAALQYYAL